MRLQHLARRRSAALLVGILALSLLAGCDQVTGMIASARPPAFQGQIAPAIQLGGGTTSAGSWTGGSDDGTTATGSTPHPTAAVAVFTLGTGEVVRIPVIRPAGPVANGHGYYMARFDAGTEIDLIVVLDASGVVLDSYPFGH